MMRRVLWTVLLAGGFLIQGAPAAQAAVRQLRLVYTAELRGNLLPCPCPRTPLGGLARRVGWVDSLRKAAPEPLLVVDGGSSLPRTEDYPLLSPSWLDELQRLQTDAAQAIGYDALAAPREPADPGGGLPWLKPNEAILLERGDLRIRLVAVDERIDPAPALPRLRALGPGDLTLLLCAGDLHYATRAARLLGAQVAVVSRGATFQKPVWKDGVLLLGPGYEGRYVGTVVLSVARDGTVTPADLQLRPMDGSVQAPPAWRSRVEELVLTLERAAPGALAIGE